MIRQIGITLIALTSIVAITLSSKIYAQSYEPTTVEISKEKVRVNGKLFYAHKVLPKQTLYSVSKAYSISIDEITLYNPSVKDGLKSDEIIYIPIKDSSIEESSISKETPSEFDSQNSTQENTEEDSSKRYKKHVVKWHENIYDISQKYKVAVDIIAHLNQLSDELVLKKRQVLLIPDKEYIMEYNRMKKGDLMSTPKKESITIFPADTSSQTQPISSIEIGTQTISPIDSSSSIDNNSIYQSYRQRSYTISIVLPFNTPNGATNVSVSVMDFYAGALVALYEFQQQSGDRNFKINMVDLSQYPTTEFMLASGVLDDSELIIGPIYENSIAPVASWAKAHKIPIISPLDLKAERLVEGNPFYFQYPTSLETQIQATFSEVSQKCSAQANKPLIIYEKGSDNSPLVKEGFSYFKGGDTTAILNTLSYGILEGRGIDLVMEKKMGTTSHNTILVLSESEAFVSDVLRNLLLVKGRHPELSISLYGTHKWKSFDILEMSHLHELDTHISLQYSTDYNSEEVKKFVENFTYNFHVDPSQFAFQGYDITYYFLNALHEYGREFPIYIENYEKKLLQSNVKFERKSSDSGFTNKGTLSINYVKGWDIICYSKP